MLFLMPVVTFFLRSNNDKAQTCVLYCRVTFKGSQSEFSTKEKLKKTEWDQRGQYFIGNARKTVFVSTLIEATAYKLKSAALVGEFSTARDLVRSVHLKKRVHTLEKLVLEYITAQRQKSSEGTIRNHQVKYENLLAYQKKSTQVFSADTFGVVEAEKFKTWFMIRANTQNIDTANRHITFFRRALHYAFKHGKIPAFELINYQGEKDAVKTPVFMTISEVEQLEKCVFNSQMLIQIKDLFLFQCYTGLSFGDIWSAWKISNTSAGKVITGTRGKNHQAFFVPLEIEALHLIQKYSGQLPKYTNEVYNRILKEIAACAGIEKRLTTHTARKTYATIMNVRGWSRESIADMLGHTSTRTTETYYIGRDFSRIEMEMNKRGLFE